MSMIHPGDNHGLQVRSLQGQGRRVSFPLQGAERREHVCLGRLRAEGVGHERDRIDQEETPGAATDDQTK